MSQSTDIPTPYDTADAVPFGGVKVALLMNGQVLTIHRDQKPGLPYAGLWDLPGGGREDRETPLATATREIQEELGFSLNPGSLQWSKMYPPHPGSNLPNWFMAFAITQPTVDSIIFGAEGQRWQLQNLDDFIQSDQAVPFLRSRLADCLRALGQ
jgi:8-oxo-dGTP diphosphatase